jgi:hypothetical protein
MSDPFKKMEEERLRALETAEKYERDMRELKRLMKEYNLLVVNAPLHASTIPVSHRRRRSPEKERLYQELRKFLEGKSEPIPFAEIYDHLQKVGAPLTGKDPRQGVSAFMGRMPEFHTHGAEGRAGWTFEADENWSVVSGFGAGSQRVPAWRHTPARQKLFETVRALLEGRTGRTKFGEIYNHVKNAGIPIGGTNERDYLALYLSRVPCFDTHKKDETGPGGWFYIPDLDEERSGKTESVQNDGL